MRINTRGAIALLLIIGSLGLGACSHSASLQGSTEQGSTEGSTQQATLVADLPPEARQIVSFRSPSCGCCEGWVEHMRAQGFQVEDNVVDDVEAVKREHNIPTDLASCHTAIANGYVIEGHIPAADVSRLLTEKPDVLGIAVPGMPIGSPGMESGDIQQPYAVYTFTEDGTPEIFQEHS
ncbi:MAG: DUF411 domain-containing protein [Elainellaceae cyanobacterium]